MTSLRDLPSVEQLLQKADDYIRIYGRPLTLEALRLTLEEARMRFQEIPAASLPSTDRILSRDGFPLGT